MLGHLGFSYIGLVYLLMLFIPNILWGRTISPQAGAAPENRVLQLFERAGQALCTCSVLIFRDFNPGPFSAWSLWLIASFLLMLLYEAAWIRYFASPRTQAGMYRSFLCIPLPLATLPVTAFLLLGIYGRVIWLIVSAVILGFGHIGIHARHAKNS